jgi:hypothetical protein
MSSSVRIPTWLIGAAVAAALAAATPTSAAPARTVTGTVGPAFAIA